MRQVIAEVTVVPLGTGSASLSEFVAACLKVLEGREDVQYQLTPMGTVIQGELKTIMDLVQKMHDIPFDMGATRVSTTVKIDDRSDKAATMDSKVRSVMKKLTPAKRKVEAPEELPTLGDRWQEKRAPRSKPLSPPPEDSF